MKMGIIRACSVVFESMDFRGSWLGFRGVA